jgi:hypothetical protein
MEPHRGAKTAQGARRIAALPDVVHRCNNRIPQRSPGIAGAALRPMPFEGVPLHLGETTGRQRQRSGDEPRTTCSSGASGSSTSDDSVAASARDGSYPRPHGNM